MVDAPPDTAEGYRAAREAAAWVDLAERGVLEVTGPQRQKFLQGMLSNDVLGRAPGTGCLAALLTVKGHIQALMRVLVTPEAVLLEMPQDRLSLVERTLEHYRVAAPVRFRARPTAVLGLLGPRAREALRDAGIEVPDLPPESHVSGQLGGLGVLVARASDLPSGFVVHVAPDGAALVREALAHRAHRLEREALDALRVEGGCAWYGPDVTEENLLHEAGLVDSHHSFTKGCYIGQEVIARLDARGGNVNKKLRGLRLSAAVRAGTPILAAGKDVGRVTTAAVSPRFGPIALAYLHRDQATPGTTLDAAGATATVVALPME
ncbi:MAG TPA: glycine cleavage T C-terminal barrel domain-containing protein [Vicinamibacteria bacterium]|jgi:folate-binding protein YgfZ|nr:glycine cleavage T C-terminal barrel domain-containing protein [Vicinamibacteria bacterium]